MRVWRDDPLTWGPPPESGSAVSIGVFDGVHRGHQAVLADVARRAEPLGDLQRVALTFDQHPKALVSPESAPLLLMTLERRLELLAGLGIDQVGVLPFSQIRDESPEAFVSKVLIGAFAARLVAVGADFRFGHRRAGDVAMLRSAGAEYGFEVDAVDLASAAGIPISSTTIRRLVSEGDVAGAGVLLGRLFEVDGLVRRGDQRGRTIGFPTANVHPADGVVVPRLGVYAGRVWIDDPSQPQTDAVVNVGVRPTFGGDVVIVEAHLLDFDEDIYDRRIGVGLVGRIRDEQTFDGVDSLIAQIGRDVEVGRSLLSTS